MQARLLLPWILAGHIALGLAFGAAMPIFEIHDEASHFLFVRYLQTYRTLPVQGQDPDAARAHHPPGYYILGALLTSQVKIEDATDKVHMEANPKFWARPDDPENDNKARYVHSAPSERWPYRDMPLAVHMLRWLSTAFSAVAVWLTYRAARHLRPNDGSFAVLASGLLAFNPQVAFLGGIVQNDTAALAGGAAVIYLLSRFAREGFTPRRWAWVGIVFAMGLLLKVSVFTLIVPIGIMWIVSCARQGDHGAYVRNGFALGMPILLIAGWWYARNSVLYGDWTGNAAIVALWRPIVPFEPQPVWEFARLLLLDVLGHFGLGGMLWFPAYVYFAGSVAIVFALCRGVGCAILRTREGLQSSEPTNAPESWLWLIHVVTLVVVSITVLDYAERIIGWIGSRFMFVAYPSLMILLATGFLVRLHRHWQSAVALSITLLNLGAALYVLFGLIIPTYAPPRSPTPSELTEMIPLDADIGGVARILGYKLDQAEVSEEQVLQVTVYWLPLVRTSIPYTVFIHLYAPDAGSLAQRDTYPGAGNWATTVWDVGRPFVDTYRLHIPPDVPSVEGAKILIGLYDGQSMQRLPVTGADAGPLADSWVEFGSIRSGK